MSPDKTSRPPFRRTVVPAGWRDRLQENNLGWTALYLGVLAVLGTLAFRTVPPQVPVHDAVLERDLRSPVDLQITDNELTEARREEAANRQAPVFDEMPGAAAEAVEAVTRRFDSARMALNQDRGAALDAVRAAAEPLELPASDWLVLIRNGFSEDTGRQLADAVRAVESLLLVARVAPLEGHEEWVERALGGRAERDVRSETVVPLAEAAARLEESLRQRNIEPSLAGALARFAAPDLAPTRVFNVQETMRRRDAARNGVAPLVRVVRRGQVLVPAGERVTEEQRSLVQQVAAQGDFGAWRARLAVLAGVAALFLYFLHHSLSRYRLRRRLEHNPYAIVVAVTVFQWLASALLIWLGGRLALLYPDVFRHGGAVVYLAPAALGGMLLILLQDRQVAVFQAVAFAPVLAIYTGGDWPFLVFALITSLAATILLPWLRQHHFQFLPGLATGVVGAVAVALCQLPDGHGGMDAWTAPAMALVSGMVVCPLLLGPGVSLCEALFAVLTESRLNSLASLNHPLLQRLAMDSPGTYNHSLTMSSMCEQAARAIGANALLVRVGCFYHDIGKSLNPEYFIENQTPGRNPHDRLEPKVSVRVIKSHVTDGIELGIKHGLPRQIVDLIPQHHGTRVLRYFYEKARAAADDSDTVDPEAFRYPGPKPQSKEGAILMLADTLEAGSRVLHDATEEKLAAMVREVADKVVLEGQLDECAITFAELARIQESFLKTLRGIKGRRISYPGYAFDKDAGDLSTLEEGAAAPGGPGTGKDKPADVH